MSIASNQQQVTAFFDAMNRGDVDAIVAAYHDDGYVWTKGHTLISGKYTRAEIQAAAGGIFETFPQGLSFTIIQMTAQDNRVAVEATSSGMHISGKLYENDYHFLFSFKDGKLLELKEYMDTERVTDILCGGQRPQ